MGLEFDCDFLKDCNYFETEVLVAPNMDVTGIEALCLACGDQYCEDVPLDFNDPSGGHTLPFMDRYGICNAGCLNGTDMLISPVFNSTDQIGYDINYYITVSEIADPMVNWSSTEFTLTIDQANHEYQLVSTDEQKRAFLLSIIMETDFVTAGCPTDWIGDYDIKLYINAINNTGYENKQYSTFNLNVMVDTITATPTLTLNGSANVDISPSTDYADYTDEFAKYQDGIYEVGDVLYGGTDIAFVGYTDIDTTHRDLIYTMENSNNCGGVDVLRVTRRLERAEPLSLTPIITNLNTEDNT